MTYCRAVLALCVLASAAGAQQAPRIVYSKLFPGSAFPYLSVTLDRTGAGQYRESPEDDSPLRFQLSEAECEEIFGLVGRLEHFRRPLESAAKVAFLGTKTFRLENGPESGEVKFNYSDDPDARLLWDWFERITASQQHLIALERAAKYDRLGILRALLALEASWDRKRLVAVRQFLPMLDRIAKNTSYMHTARVRAAGLAEAFRAAP